MKLLVTTAVMFACFSLAGCAFDFRPVMHGDKADTSYGPPPPANHQDLVKRTLSSFWINPDSPVYQFDAPAKGQVKGNRLNGMRPENGWIVCGTVNRKPKWGGYTGYSTPLPFFVLFKNGQITDRLVGVRAESIYDHGYLVNAEIKEVCDSRTKTAVDAL